MNAVSLGQAVDRTVTPLHNPATFYCLIKLNISLNRLIHNKQIASRVQSLEEAAAAPEPSESDLHLFMQNYKNEKRKKPAFPNKKTWLFSEHELLA